ncbi:MAG: hypothetical protein GC151_11900 [Betaproteobacteria bacterium]|nr:hypothetical protein [Betaproteobacteria bacterium]
MRLVPLVAMLAVLNGCASYRLFPDNPVAISADFQPPADAILAGVVIGAAAYYVLDPLAPNWEVRAERLDVHRVEIRLRKKRFSTGGDGEAQDLFQRRAEEIAYRNGAPGFEILSYSEGIDSETAVARRVAHGVVRLLPPA